MPGYTTTDLINTVKSTGMIPDASTGSLSPQALLQYATMELQGPIMGLILSAREKYYETFVDTAMVAGNPIFAVPQRAAGGVLSAVQYLYLTDIVSLTPLDSNEAATINPALYPRGYYFQNNNIVIYPTPSSTQGTIRMRYFQRPSRLEQTVNCGQITAINLIANTVTVASVPPSWTTGTIIDFVPQFIPYTPYGLYTVLTGVTGNVLSMSAVPATAAVGDWTALAEFTPIPEVPYEFFQVLAEATLCKAMQATGDAQNFQISAARLAEYKATALKFITPRDQQSPKKVVSNWRNF